MRFANQIRPMVVGLPIVVSHALLVALPAAAWDWGIFGGDENKPAVAQAGHVPR